VDRPTAAHEMANAEEGDAEQDEPEAAVQHELDLPVVEKPYHRSCNGAIGRCCAELSHSIGAAIDAGQYWRLVRVT
jgi:hypothetical protein